MASIIRNTSRGQLVTYIFAQDAVAASQTNVQLVVPGETTTPLVVGYEMPFPGEVVALSYTLDTAGAAGVFTIGATLNGTEAVSYTHLDVYKRQADDIARAIMDSMAARITTER